MAKVCLKSGEQIVPVIEAHDELVHLRIGSKEEVVMLPGDALDLGHRFIEASLEAVRRTDGSDGHEG